MENAQLACEGLWITGGVGGDIHRGVWAAEAEKSGGRTARVRSADVLSAARTAHPCGASAIRTPGVRWSDLGVRHPDGVVR